ncbi:PREDICTED: protein IQ-DOMAIN 1-like isoform X2 [Lupinus angustifolius]|uniref:protein IQ-DOMAIN 1-like isoform X2 n=1 Tax=Lupinus angustifolius TaxID=3871 RepID=UPI00092E7264|nr:PREDICTED: protein IQ-DOMAIN 1-like isoform X2 [Lupinus angustifolius]
MAIWKCLFGWKKKLLFTSESKEKNPKKWRCSDGKSKLKNYPTITATDRTLIEAKSEQRKHALTVAIATASAAEAAVAAANAAAEVVRLTTASCSYSYQSNGDRNMAAIKIQTEFRAHLARKALRALKGVVRLQAIVRGQAARRELSSTSKKLLSNARKQVEVQERCNYSDEERCKHDKFKQFANRKKSSEEKEMKNELCSQRKWNCSLHSGEGVEDTWLRKQEAIVKRERMNQYSCSHKEITIPEMVEVSGRESSHILNVGQFVHKERASLSSKGWYNTTKVAHRNLKKQDLQEGLSSQISTQRKSFSHGKKKCVVDDNFMANSQVFPSYMAVTESTKAKIRSLSSPRQRKRYFDECSNHSVPQNKGIPF